MKNLEVKVIIVGSGAVGKMAIEKLKEEAPEIRSLLVSEKEFKRETIAENEVVFLASELLNTTFNKVDQAITPIQSKSKYHK